MKKIALLLVTVVFCLSAAPVLAQTHWLGVHGSAVLPTQDLEEITISGGGGGFLWDFAFSKAFQTRVDVGWMQFSSKDHGGDLSSKARVIPARVGLHWKFGPSEGVKFYLGAMVGAYMQEITGDGIDSQEETFFGFSPVAGMFIPVGSKGNEIELNVSYDNYTDNKSSDEKDLDMGFVRLGVGFRFGI